MQDERMKKLEALIAKGINPYPYSYDRKEYAGEVKREFPKFDGKEVSLAGRLLSRRRHGKLIFADLQDVTGKIQLCFRFDEIGEEKFNLFELFDIGDLIGVKGKAFKTQRGEESVMISDYTMLGKAIRDLPEKWHGLTDIDARYRQRYIDLIMNDDAMQFAMVRSKMISAIRQFLDANRFIEVETPILQPIYGGAAARPFKTYHNALKSELFLRIAVELYLKRLIIGGMERVYEIGKNFRNEDIDSKHNPEFTMVEFYSAYWDYNDVMNFCEKLFCHVVNSVYGKTKIPYQGKELEFGGKWARVSFVDGIKEGSGVDVLSFKSDEEARAVAKKLGVVVDANANIAHVIDAMFDEYLQPKLIQPTFVIDYPAIMCPLTKAKRGDPRLSERFELFVGGRECANAYSEMTDPIEQRKKFMEQAQELGRGDEEAQPWDEDFLVAIEHGMPPTGGIGIGIDRLAMLITDNISIKEVILFPSMKPKTDAIEK